MKLVARRNNHSEALLLAQSQSDLFFLLTIKHSHFTQATLPNTFTQIRQSYAVHPAAGVREIAVCG